MRGTARIRLPGEADENDIPEAYRADSLLGHWAPVLPPAAAAPAIGAVLQEVILVDLTRSLAAGDLGLSAAGSSAAKGKPVGGGGSGGGETGGTVSSYTSGAAGGYNVTIQFKGTWTATLQNVFKAAADRISTIIVGDVANVRVKGGTIDDIQISAELKAIDGAGGVLGQAGPTSLRVGSYLPATAMMEFDVDDASAFHAAGFFDEIVTHEMLHGIGYGSIWSYKGLSGSNFIGGNAMAEYDKLVDAFQGFDNGVNALAVPLESGGGAGTMGSHWSEAVFRHELMTGWLDTASPAPGMVAAPLSLLTVASMKDLGYVVSSAPPVDAYFLT